MDIIFILFSLFALLYSLIASRVDISWLSGPLIFICFGIVVGPLGADWLNIDIKGQNFKLLVDLTLTLFLFIDASNANQSILKSQIAIPVRMLVIAFPLTIFSGVLAGLLIFDSYNLLQLIILATALAATDAALGKGILVNHNVPKHLRESLNVESGLNDGLAVPVLLFFLTIINIPTEQQNYFDILTIFIREIGIGVLIGVGVTYVGLQLINLSYKLKYLTEVWIQIPIIALAFLCFFVANAFHGSGYIAAFTGGIVFGRLAKSHVHEFVVSAESLAEIFAMITWVLFGSIVLAKTYGLFNWNILLYSILSLTIVRMIPIFIALIGTKQSYYNRFFLGWFGPRGLASIVFCVLIIDAQIPNSQEIVLTIVCTILLSVLLHGITAKPLSKVFNRQNSSDAHYKP